MAAAARQLPGLHWRCAPLNKAQSSRVRSIDQTCTRLARIRCEPTSLITKLVIDNSAGGDILPLVRGNDAGSAQHSGRFYENYYDSTLHLDLHTQVFDIYMDAALNGTRARQAVSQTEPVPHPLNPKPWSPIEACALRCPAQASRVTRGWSSPSSQPAAGGIC